jgi:hypothetical protein
MNVPRNLICTAFMATVALTGCGLRPTYDPTAFRAAKPATLVIMPPINSTTEHKAEAAVWAQATRPLAEAGYYVLPVTLVDAVLREHGVTTAQDAHNLPAATLRSMFSADAAVFIEITRFGTTYVVINSNTRVTVFARIVDLRDGKQLWSGRADVSHSPLLGGLNTLSAENLAATAILHVAALETDAAFRIAGEADRQLLGLHNDDDSVLLGPRAPLQ